jgi:hypothetical protein
VCIYCIARGVVIFCVVNMTLTCEWMNEIDMLCFLVETEETGTCSRPYWWSGISSTRERNSASFHSLRYVPLVKRRHFSHSWKKSQIFNRDSYKNLLIYHVKQWVYLVFKENILIATLIKRVNKNVDIKFSAHERFWNNLIR